MFCPAQTTKLTSTDFDLFYLLAREAGKVLHRDDILNQLRVHDAGLCIRAVDIVVSRLRKKLEPPDAVHKLRRRWHRRARHSLGHSLRVPLLTLFLLLAKALAATFTYGMQKALSVGWRVAARRRVSDYVDRLVLEIGSPHSIKRAQALTQRNHEWSVCRLTPMRMDIVSASPCVTIVPAWTKKPCRTWPSPFTGPIRHGAHFGWRGAGYLPVQVWWRRPMAADCSCTTPSLLGFLVLGCAAALVALLGLLKLLALFGPGR